jgi:hypothetical protein
MPVSTRRKFTRTSPSIVRVKSTTPPTLPNPTNGLRHEAANIYPPETFREGQSGVYDHEGMALQNRVLLRPLMHRHPFHTWLSAWMGETCPPEYCFAGSVWLIPAVTSQSLVTAYVASSVILPTRQYKKEKSPLPFFTTKSYLHACLI